MRQKEQKETLFARAWLPWKGVARGNPQPMGRALKRIFGVENGLPEHGKKGAWEAP
jgi:hypothetical protein